MLAGQTLFRCRWADSAGYAYSAACLGQSLIRSLAEAQPPTWGPGAGCGKRRLSKRKRNALPPSPPLALAARPASSTNPRDSGATDYKTAASRTSKPSLFHSIPSHPHSRSTQPSLPAHLSHQFLFCLFPIHPHHSSFTLLPTSLTLLLPSRSFTSSSPILIVTRLSVANLSSLQLMSRLCITCLTPLPLIY